jgi:DNA polymerase-3 subunit alpha
MFGALDEAMRAGQSFQRDQASNQMDIFGMLGMAAKGVHRADENYPNVAEWSAQESLAYEKEALGFYISGHPLDKYERVLKKVSSGIIGAVKDKAVPGEIRLGGVVSSLKLRNTKKGERYANFNLEDKSGFLEVITWPDVYKKCGELLGGDAPILIKGRLETGEDRIQVIANEVVALADAVKQSKNGAANGRADGSAEKFHLYVRESEVSADELVRLRDTLLDFPGRATVLLHMLGAGLAETVIELPEQVRIAPTAELEAALAQLFEQRVTFHFHDA